MAAVDEELCRRMPMVKGRTARYIDDVTYFAQSPAAGVEFAETYVEVLARFALVPNDMKTQHHERVVPPVARWAPSVKRIIRDLRGAGSSELVVRSLSEALDLADEHGVAPLRYLLASVQPSVAVASTWPLYQDFLGIVIRRDPLLLPHLHRWLMSAKRRGYLSRFTRIDANLTEYLEVEVRAQHSWEVASVINILTDLGTTIDSAHAASASELEDDIVDLMLIEAATKARRLVSIGRRLRDRASAPDAFLSGHWLVAYEVQRREPGRRTTEFLAGDWSQLASSGVEFIRDPAASPLGRRYQAQLAMRSRRSSYASP
jgi:hypothetical protein